MEPNLQGVMYVQPSIDVILMEKIIVRMRDVQRILEIKILVKM